MAKRKEPEILTDHHVVIRRGAMSGQKMVEILADGHSDLAEVCAVAEQLWRAVHGNEEVRKVADLLSAANDRADRAERERDTLRRWFGDYAPPGTNPTIELGDLEAFVRALAGALGEPDSEIFDRPPEEGEGDELGFMAEVVSRRISALLAHMGNGLAESFNIEHGTVFELPGEASF